MSDNASRQVVFDHTLTDVFMAMAFQEGLLKADHTRTDGVFRRYETMNPPEYLKRMVLEQVVLSPNIIKADGYPLDWLSGDLIERNIIKDIPAPTDDETVVSEISVDIILAMLAAKNIQMSEPELLRIIDETQEAIKRADDYLARTGNETLSGMTLGFYRMLKRKIDLQEYSDDDIAFFEAQQAIYDKAQPIANVINEYTHVQSLANQNDALMRIPTTFTPNAPLISPITPHEIEKEIALVRIASTELGRLNYRPTLRESLELAEHETTVEFYKQLMRWKIALSSGNLNAVEIIHKDVELASGELEKVAKIENTNRIVTYMSLPVALVELLPIPSIAGFTATVYGFVSTAKADAVKNKYKWAMFGNK